MHDRLKKQTRDGDDFETLDDLLHPAQAFSHPSDVVNDPDLTLNEKRAILASWASDACAVGSTPALPRAKWQPAGRVRGNHGCASRSRQAGA